MNDKCAFLRHERCVVLTDTVCSLCKYRKTEDQLNAGRDKALNRIRKLPLGQQDHIMNKYYTAANIRAWRLPEEKGGSDR